MIYDIITSPVELEGYAVDAVINSAANFSMISLSLAKKLNLLLYKNDLAIITLANDIEIPTHGICKDIKIKINKFFYHTTLKVLKDAAQDLLLGMDFIGSYKINILTEFRCISIKETDGYNVNPINIFTQEIKNLREFRNTKENICCYTKEKITLEPFETKIINVKIPTDKVEIQAK
ncbi:hypothetical protein COBT_003491, partial [Conglomerata obtusa]